jgi:site-specific recombinase XerD
MSLARGGDGSAEIPSAEAPPLESSLIQSPTPEGVACLILKELKCSGVLAEQTTNRLGRTMDMFGRYLEVGIGLGDLREVRPEHADGFIRASTSHATGSPPSVATQHFRRSAIRLFFRVARRLNLVDSDPTLDISLPPRSSLNHRPLTDDEISACRSAALRTLTETRQPAAWALGEATARTSELPRSGARTWTSTAAGCGSVAGPGRSRAGRH